ncbi:response regulator transcription factor [Streptomyces niveiscabiei]|uniref:helix-turn-helix transcriptional regulator n=1 Tax=Streptomyces niveiscabiei TaxID=164115 RepID=UPI0029B8D602|nr:response regulator transcription factor [Streptomyces niveiscabiei]MDX3384754.1 response regulator transcription factor [Streptomyces niveiscabiei]
MPQHMCVEWALPTPGLSIALVSQGTPPPAALAHFRTRQVGRRSDVRPDDDVLLFHGPGAAHAVRRFRLAAGPGLPPAAVLAPRLDWDDVSMALDHGATSYLVETSPSPQLLAEALDLTSQGATVLAPVVAEHVKAARRSRTGIARRRPCPDAAGRLSPRERELMARLTSGDTVPEIAAGMNLTQKTVTNYLSRIYQKLGARSRSDAILRWLGVLEIQAA